MKVFESMDDGAPSPGPRFEAIDTIQSSSEADTLALCRLFKVTNPSTGAPAYTFGISKEGRVFLWMGKSQTGEEKGRSVDASVAGMIKAVVGAESSSRTSVDLRTVGGVKLDIGSFRDQNPDPNKQDNVSVDVTLSGKVKFTLNGQQGREIAGTSDFRSMSSSVLDSIGGNYVEQVGGAKAIEATSIGLNSGLGGYKLKVAGDYGKMVAGKSSETYSQQRTATFALGDSKTVVAGTDSVTVLAGGINRTVVAGSGINDTVTAGNFSQTCAAGNFSMSVGTGNLMATVGAGNLAMTAGAGNVTVMAGIVGSFVAGAVANVTAPMVKIGAAVVGFAVAGAPGPPSPHIDYLTGIPILGVPTVTLG